VRGEKHTRKSEALDRYVKQTRNSDNCKDKEKELKLEKKYRNYPKRKKKSHQRQQFSMQPNQIDKRVSVNRLKRRNCEQ